MSALAIAAKPRELPASPIAELRDSSELELLLVCARRTLSASGEACACELLAQPLDWSRLLELAQAHGLLPLFWWHAERILAHDLPPQIAQALRARFRDNAVRNLFLMEELFDILGVLGDCDISAVPLKGPVLADRLYGDPALRECVDLDIMLRARDVPEAIRSLISAGYQPSIMLTPVQQKAFLSTQYEYALLSPAGTLVELQWRIVPRYFSLAFVEEQYWGRIQPIAVCGREVNSFSAEDLLLLLAFHGGKHAWKKLIWLADLAELMASSPRLDWGYVIDRARRAGGLRMLLLGVFLSRKLLGSAVPKDIEQLIDRDCSIAQIAGGICRAFVTRESPSYVKSQLYLLRVRERWRDRLRYVVRFTLTGTPTEWKLVDFPRPFFFLYRFLRLLRGLGKARALVTNVAAGRAKAKV